MTPPFTSRPATPEDREFLFRVYASTREEELAPVPWLPAQKDAFLRQQFSAQDQHYQRAYAEGEFSILQVSGEDIGRLYVWRGAQEIRIVDIALLPAWRGRGIGGRVIARLLEEAATVNKPATIHVEEYNPAQRLYQRLGFQRVKQNGIYWLLQWVSAVEQS